MGNSDASKEGSLARLTQAFDALDQGERLQRAASEDRKWMWAQRVPGRAEYYETFRGADEIIEWMETALKADRGGYIPASMRRPLLDMSRAFDQRIFSDLGRGIPDADYDKFIGQWNADDFIYANAYPVPDRQKVTTLLDFGAGYGRQLNLWHQHVPDLRYIAVDVIRKPYLCQCAYFQYFDLPCSDYVLDPKEFRIDAASGIYHVPGWRLDLVENDSVDMVLAIMVLPELHPDTLYRTLDTFQRILKPGGALFVRDHGLVVKSANTEDVAEALRRRGFVLEFRPYVKDLVELRGVPRIWRKRDPAIPVADEPDKTIKGIIQGLRKVLAK